MKTLQCPKCESSEIIAILKHTLHYEVGGIDEEGVLVLGDLIDEFESGDGEFRCDGCGLTWKIPTNYPSLEE